MGEEVLDVKKPKEDKTQTKKKKKSKGSKGDNLEITGPGQSIHMFRRCLDD